MQSAKHLATDALGILLLVIALLIGWLPGPGGIPLTIAGLALLAVNHNWARRWLALLVKSGETALQKIRRSSPPDKK